MVAQLYYFTGTGNSLSVARRLASALGARAPEPMVRHLAGGAIDASSDGSPVGLVYPVHHWGPADVVLRFARKLRVPGNAYVFAVATYGNHSGRAFQDLNAALGESGHGLDAGFHVRTVQNYVPVFVVPGEDILRRTLAEADAQVDEVAQRVVQRASGEREHWWWRPSVRAYYLASKRGLHRKDAAFQATDACDSCGVCARVCPVGNITLEDDKPSWRHECEQCFACLHWCPRGAIEWGGATRGMGRYHHPDVSVDDMVVQAPAGSPAPRGH